MKPHVYIMTTMTPRHEIHADCVYPFLKQILKDCRPEFEFLWFVNIDDIEGLEPHRLTDVHTRVVDFAKEHDIKLWCNVETENVGFSHAAKRLFRQVASNQVAANYDKHLYFWFEDDWELKDKTRYSEFSQELSNFYTNRLARYCNFQNPDRVTGAPSIFKKDLFDEILHLYATKHLIDPERTMERAALRLWFDKVFIDWRFHGNFHMQASAASVKNVPKALRSGSITQWCEYNRFDNIGYKWRSEKGFYKSSRYDDVGWVRYTGGTSDPEKISKDGHAMVQFLKSVIPNLGKDLE